jgi:hypothetical protein
MTETDTTDDSHEEAQHDDNSHLPVQDLKIAGNGSHIIDEDRNPICGHQLPDWLDEHLKELDESEIRSIREHLDRDGDDGILADFICGNCNRVYAARVDGRDRLVEAWKSYRKSVEAQ